MRSLNSKKGQSIIQPLFIAIIMFAFAIIAFIMVFVYSTIGGALQGTTLNDDPAQADAILSLKNFGSTYVGGLYIFVFFGLCFGLVITSFLVPEHPIFIIAYILMLLACVFMTAILANFWVTFTELSQFADIAVEQTVINFMMRNIVKIMVAVFLLSILIIFGRPFIVGGESSGGRM